MCDKITQQQVLTCIYAAIDEFNAQLDAGADYIEKKLEARLFGPESPLDSLGLVNLIAVTEAKLEELLGVTVMLANERALAQTESPFSTVNTLLNYIHVLITEDGQH